MNSSISSPREIALFVPLGLLILWMGVYPTSFIEIMAPAVDRMVGGYHTALLLGGAPHLASLAPQVIP
jgi:NADH-quinone oxidoreductase subunit M